MLYIPGFDPVPCNFPPCKCQGWVKSSLCRPWRHMGEWRFITIHFKLDTGDVSDQLHNLATSYVGPKPLILMNRGWVNIRVSLDTFEKRIISFHCQKSNHDTQQACSLVIVLSILPWHVLWHHLRIHHNYNYPRQIQPKKKGKYAPE